MFGQANIMAAANMDTEMVLPKRRGVLTRISCGVLSHELISRRRLWERANAPGPSRLKKTRAQLLRYSSWKRRWWKERCQPLRSSASRARRHFCMRLMPSMFSLIE